jgi:anaerobic selenocysteine-containing dehydrogenase
LIVSHGNPALVLANTKKIERAFKQLNFMMVLDMFPTATAQMAHLVLPSPSLFESYGYRAYSSREGGFISYKPKLIEPLGESRHFARIEYEIAERIGFAEGYPFRNDKEWVKFMLKPTGLTTEDFEGKAVVYATKPMTYRKYLKTGFSTPSKKVEFYSETYEKHGQDPLPEYREPASLRDWKNHVRQRYPLKGTTRKQYEYVHTKFRNLEYLKKLYPTPLVTMHPEDAAAHHIGEGDTVRIESPYGHAVMKTKISEFSRRGLIVLDYGWGNPWDAPDSNANCLVQGDVCDPVSGGTPNRLFYCKIQKMS